MLNNQAANDYTKAISGKDGQLYITSSTGANIFLGEVDEFQLQTNVTNTDWQPVGSILTFAISTGINVTLSFTETVIRDDFTLKPLLDELNQGFVPTFGFQGKMRRRDGQAERITMRNCVPDGAIDLMHLVPGEKVTRQWSFRVNDIPEALETFT